MLHSPKPDGRRVVMTTDALGGLWTYALDLGGTLSGRGYEMILAVLGSGLDPARQAEALRRGLHVVALGHHPDGLARSAAEIEAAGTAVATLVRRRTADILHLNHPALLAHVRCPCPVVAFCHSCAATRWAAVRGGSLPIEARWRADLTERGLAAAAVMVAPSQAFAESTRSAYGFGLAPLAVHHGRPTGAAMTTPQEAPAPTIFTGGRLWDEAKNVAALDRAARRLPVPVLAAGPVTGPNGATITLRHIRTLGILADIGMRATLETRPIYVSTALYEPFGRAVLEAAQAGCAIVLSDIPSFRELWDGAALFVPPHDDKSIAAEILRLLGDRALRAELGQASRNRSGAYTLDACADGTERAYAAARAAHQRAPSSCH